ncbi:MAG TPA: hypothetical protein VLX68_06635 [Chitinivibrionales bacterium]|nr:hypothetical protein [Chitinivibrionales bacterium]
METALATVKLSLGLDIMGREIGGCCGKLSGAGAVKKYEIKIHAG